MREANEEVNKAVISPVYKRLNPSSSWKDGKQGRVELFIFNHPVKQRLFCKHIYDLLEYSVNPSTNIFEMLSCLSI